MNYIYVLTIGWHPIISTALITFLSSVVGLTFAFLCFACTIYFVCTNFITPTFKDGFRCWRPIQFETCKWININICWWSLQLKSSFSEKGTKIWKNLPLVLTLLSKTGGRFFSNFAAFSKCLNFKVRSASIRNRVDLDFLNNWFSFE